MSATYVYLSTNQGDGTYIHTVGFYDPEGQWTPESDHDSSEEAAKRVHYLNGGNE